MRQLTRPLWNCGLTWLAVLLTAAWLPPIWLWWAVVAALVCLLLVLIVPFCRRNHPLVLITISTVLALTSLAYCETVRYQPLIQRAEETVFLRAAVDKSENVTQLTVLAGDLPRNTRLLLWAEPEAAALRSGDSITAEFTLKLPDESGLSSKQRKASGVWLAAIPNDASAGSWTFKRMKPSFMDKIEAYRGGIVTRIQDMLSGDTGGVVNGICLGVDEVLSSKAVSDFRNCGVAHLFAVSGLHLSVLTQALLALLKRCKVPRSIRGLITAIAVAGLIFFIGFSPSLVRAGILCVLVALGSCIRRQADTRNSLGLALLVLLVGDPFAVYDVSLLLSFSATFGLVFIAPNIRAWLMKLPLEGWVRRVWKYIADTVAVTASATLATLAVTVLFFRSISLVGILANLLMMLPATILLVAGWLSIFAVAANAVVLYRPLLFVAGYIAKFLLWVAESLADLPYSSVAVTEPYAIVWVLGSLLLIGVGYRLFRWRGTVVTVGVCAVVLCSGVSLTHYLQRDTMFIRPVAGTEDLAVCLWYEGQAALVISPTNIQSLYAARAALQREGITSLDAVCIPAGEAVAISYIPLVLEEYVVTAQFYAPSKETQRLWNDDGTMTWEEERVYLRFGDTCVVFGEGENLQTDTQCFFAAGTVTVHDGLYTIFEQNGRFPCLRVDGNRGVTIK